MKMLLSLLALIFVWPSQAGDLVHVIKVHGTELKVLELETREIYESGYRATGKRVNHTAEVAEPTILNFIFGNQFYVEEDTHLYFHNNGNISTMRIDNNMPPVLWSLFNGENLVLNCQQLPPKNELPARGRYVRFHDNGQYSDGCDLHLSTWLTAPSGDRFVVNPGRIDLNYLGEIQYASSVRGGNLTLAGDKLELATGKSLYFFGDGSAIPNWFFLKKGQTFTQFSPKYGKIKFGQLPDEIVSTTLFSDGSVERGILKSKLTMDTVTLPPNTGVQFARFKREIVNKVVFAFFSKPFHYLSRKYSLSAKAMEFDQKGRVVSLNLADALQFYYKGHVLQLYANSTIKINPVDNSMDIPKPYLDYLLYVQRGIGKKPDYAELNRKPQ